MKIAWWGRGGCRWLSGNGVVVVGGGWWVAVLSPTEPHPPSPGRVFPEASVAAPWHPRALYSVGGYPFIRHTIWRISSFYYLVFIETQRRGKPNTLTRSNVRKGSADISYGYMYIHICFILLVRYEIIHTCICVSVYLYVCYTCIFFYIILYDYVLIIKFSIQCLAPNPSSNQLTGWKSGRQQIGAHDSSVVRGPPQSKHGEYVRWARQDFVWPP